MPRAEGAQIVLIPELFEGPYFCMDSCPSTSPGPVRSTATRRSSTSAAVAAELGVVLPLSVYERAGQATFNTVVVVDADGAVLGTYRKSHIPDGPGYTEKYYFNPGDTGFRVWHTQLRHDRRRHLLGPVVPRVGARAWRCSGAEVLLYPTAIGSEPPDPSWDSSGHWQRVMQGHAGANLMPLVAANRVGHEVGADDARSRSTARRSSPTPPAPRSPRPTATARPC